MRLRAIFLAACALLPFQAHPTWGMVYRDNQVWFLNRVDDYASEAFLSGAYNVTTAVIPNGQDPLHYYNTTVGRDHPLMNTRDRWNTYFSFLIGRVRSSDVAAWWNMNITAGRCTFGHDAKVLNFAFVGDLRLAVPIPQLNMTFKNIALAQGDAGTSYNWWIGGQHCGRVSGKSDTVLCPGTLDNGTEIAGYFHRGRGGKPHEVIFGPVIKAPVEF